MTTTIHRNGYLTTPEGYQDEHFSTRLCSCEGCYRTLTSKRIKANLKTCAACQDGKCSTTPKGQPRKASVTEKIHAPNGHVVWRGKSPDDGAPIAVVVTLKSDNEKTDDMAQTWILREDVHPSTAIKFGLDGSICGSGPKGCIHRSKASGGLGSCYVVVAQAPSNVYRNMKAGAYPEETPKRVGEMLKGRPVRLGSYGDPGMVPTDVWLDLVRHASKRTGYTHQAEQSFFDPKILDVCMLSADSENHRQGLAKAFPGARAFTVITDQKTLDESGALHCPADEKREGGKVSDCASCGLCFGAVRNATEDTETPAALQSIKKQPKNIGIITHGTWAGYFNETALTA